MAGGKRLFDLTVWPRRFSYAMATTVFNNLRVLGQQRWFKLMWSFDRNRNWCLVGMANRSRTIKKAYELRSLGSKFTVFQTASNPNRVVRMAGRLSDLQPAILSGISSAGNLVCGPNEHVTNCRMRHSFVNTSMCRQALRQDILDNATVRRSTWSHFSDKAKLS